MTRYIAAYSHTFRDELKNMEEDPDPPDVWHNEDTNRMIETNY